MPATQRNLRTLKADGIHFVGPNDGEMACGEFGPGRMAEPAEIVAAIEALLDARRTSRLPDSKVLITAGPTREPIDPVRYISNHSSGKQGYAIAEAAVAAGRRSDSGLRPGALADRRRARSCARSRPRRRDAEGLRGRTALPTSPSSRPPLPTGAWPRSRARS